MCICELSDTCKNVLIKCCIRTNKTFIYPRSSFFSPFNQRYVLLHLLGNNDEGQMQSLCVFDIFDEVYVRQTKVNTMSRQ